MKLILPDSSPLLTVGCILKADEPVSLNLTKSLPYPNNSDTTVMIRNASVIIYSKGVTPDTLTYKEVKYGNLINGSYISENGFIPFSGSTYQIKIKVPGFNDLSSQTLVPQPVPILAVDTNTIYIKNGDRNEKVVECTIKFQDPPDKNYYKLSIVTGILNCRSEIPYNCVTITSKHSASFYCHDINVIYRKINQNAPGSISIESEDQEISTTEGFLSDIAFNGNIYELKVLLNPTSLPIITTPPTGLITTNVKIYIRLYSIDEEYYKYSSSYFNQLFNKNNMFSEPIQVYSNISNGVGIFSGASVSTDSSLIMPINYGTVFN